MIRVEVYQHKRHDCLQARSPSGAVLARKMIPAGLSLTEKLELAVQYTSFWAAQEYQPMVETVVERCDEILL